MLDIISKIIPKAQAACIPGEGNLNLADCLVLGDRQTTVSSVNAYQTPGGFVNLIVSNLFVLAGIFIFIAFIVAGFKFISGSKAGVDDSKKIATTAVTGFIIMFSAYWIVKIIELITGANIIF